MAALNSLQQQVFDSLKGSIKPGGAFYECDLEALRQSIIFKSEVELRETLARQSAIAQVTPAEIAKHCIVPPPPRK